MEALGVNWGYLLLQILVLVFIVAAVVGVLRYVFRR